MIENPGRRVLLLAATTGYQIREFRNAAERAGIRLALATDRCHVLEDPWGDDAIPIRLEQAEESAQKIVESAREHPIGGVVAVGDPTTRIGALASSALGLPYHPVEAVEACRNKFLARERWRAAGLPVPWYARFAIHQDAARAAGTVPFPCVLKPLGLAGSRGVIRADDTSQFEAAFVRIRALLETADVRKLREEAGCWIQVESYIPGCEVAVEGLLTRGRLRILALFDKPDPLEGPYFEETIYVTPSRLAPEAQATVIEATRRAAAAVGLCHGPLHGELRLNDDGAWMLEMAARPIGGLCARALRFGSGMPLEELILRHAAGEAVEEIPREGAASGVMMIPIPHAGVLEAVKNVEEAAQTPGVEGVEITAKPRQQLVPLPEGSSYLGFIFARGESPEIVEEALRRAHGKLRFVISPSLTVV